MCVCTLCSVCTYVVQCKYIMYEGNVMHVSVHVMFGMPVHQVRFVRILCMFSVLYVYVMYVCLYVVMYVKDVLMCVLCMCGVYVRM